ncbi:bifunctional adenosylcobinamide kinase/adenosylcobinamide-phosphate guanylyltransferase [Pseudoalteromonas luteoviolacea]|uniref:bifunctional adenosylcobinamide kinase/adenosylcobinamide-phosphate guanylyltransferase n=1 Tax=Pseudoalteromonas luteoviolacea TaxID=43657 RepID=UPI001B379475|nr:bifunctional adenosylcobinamide kinase/adenosylcobinamide-phosphate guanylyltransferase [Pseudoalteromonas luteoviolacea]MBQ4813596.1 bifunctional adenosylcobinamide kinase/adenosylcobinamide-phosphate guanylyltransferase [Pseudoalteromonas luteoviolacea]
MTKRVELIIGGARSGKSSLAECRAERWLSEGHVEELIYIATAQSKDNEMAARIAHHKATRSPVWQVQELPWEIADIIAQITPKQCVLIDCLTLWLTYGLCEVSESEFNNNKFKLLEALKTTQGSVILVSNEVGHGIVPMGELSRRFVDESGWLNQDIATIADRVDFVMAGLPLNLKSEIK